MGCGKGESIYSSSSQFASLAERLVFVERYLTFRPSYEGFHLHFPAIYDDGNSGMISSPGEWNVRLMAVVPDDEIDQWIE